ncbi:MAG: septum formation protein Maf [bacterium]|nr:septum formation protein Maf [bacterium]
MYKELTKCPERHLYLASSSPRRAEILNNLNIPFTTIANRLENEFLPDNPKNILKSIRELTFQKAFLSKKNLKGLILGTDTIVVLKDKVLGKPKDLCEAKKYLSLLSSNTHKVISGFCILDTVSQNKYCRTETTHVTFNKLDNFIINDYCNNYQVLDKAGAYAIQDAEKILISQIRGSYYNVVGLPVDSLLKILNNYDIN